MPHHVRPVLARGPIMAHTNLRNMPSWRFGNQTQSDTSTVQPRLLAACKLIP